ACMDDATKDLMKHIAEINLAYQHKPFNPTSEQHKKFLQSFHQKTKRLQEQHVYLDFSTELEFFGK
ncbi:hypothetical protein ABTO88_19485, partial [Acinetobacter baumannii]